MEYIQSIISDVSRNWMIYASMPVVAALIGYGTKLVAIRMMFEPLDFVGLKPWFGWQGIVPRNAERMASIACDTMTSRLLSPRDVFGRLDPLRVAREVQEPLLAMVEDITRDVAMAYQPGLWEMLPERVRGIALGRIKSDAPRIVEQIMTDMQKNLDEVFDLKGMVVRNLMRDRELLNRIFREVGHAEFRFIAHSGIYFGFVLGIVQAVTWALTHSPWIMPVFGGITGWLTDWLALKMVFRPQEPTRYLGVFQWQGLFLKRRKEVAAEYGKLIADEIITPQAIMEEVLRGPLSDRLFDMVQKHVRKSVDDQAGMIKPLVAFAVGGQRYSEMKNLVAEKMMERLPDTMKHVEEYAEEAMDVRNTLITKMQELTPNEFEGLLRPAFQQDEWILITVGAVLGALVGELQVQVMINFGALS